MTNALRRIRNAWYFYHALVLVIKVVCGNIVSRCSPLKRALCLRGINEFGKCCNLVCFGDFRYQFTCEWVCNLSR
ncbi:TPA: DUF3265 domain-containing protein [Vibrio parahaemolyticus]|nr:DUF3265 domain-containing protein [Vibrio parahaemolyticus]HCG5307107.1 DUF3265 domain-containing protein [Vibrio parahaemolyticus]HCG7534190.1 DUF3265 domain-containing protein [Vibrio parahaemolyticus]HCG8238712.1 DUF3265 domain-containing protein [Vibrio parahaemolyticus]HCJ2792501.1 DUF3265 domain-containing protein [Vibrio parahaemolyticus]